jgi:hypothetical protein
LSQGPGGEFYRGVRSSPAKRDAVGLEVVNELRYLAIPVDVDDVDRESHKEHVHRVAGCEDYSFALWEVRPKHQAPETGEKGIASLYSLGELSAVSEVSDNKNRLHAAL